MKKNKPLAVGLNSRLKPLAGTAPGLIVLLLAGLVLSCLKPVGFGPGDFEPAPGDSPPADSTAADPVPIVITGITPATGHVPKMEITATSDYMGTIDWSPTITESTPYKDQFKPFQDYIATIQLFMKPGHSLPPAETSVTVDGALNAVYDAATGTIVAQFPRTHSSVDSVDELNTAITALPSLPALTGANNKNIIKLTQAFYTSVNCNTKAPSYIPIGISANTTIPYTVQGLGKFSTDKLKVGILLANDNITLEDVRIEITESSKGVPRKWSGSSSYRAAILIGRYTTTPGSGASFEASDSGSKNVTVKNCNISFKDNTSMIAGILISDGKTLNEHITIDHNEVAVEITKDGTYAAQALLVYRYDPGISITNNGLSSKNMPITASSSGGATVNPAGGILLHIVPNMDNSVTPLISDNTINGYPTYDFYINILSASNRASIPALLTDNFATPNSTWMTAASTDTGSFYKKLLTTLLEQSRKGAGYGFLALWLKYSDTQNDYVFECYSLTSGKLRAIDFWGYEIDKGPVYKTTPEVRARLLLDDIGSVYEKNAQFHWTHETEGNQDNGGENKTSSL
jgi:hypothetical protein